MFEEPKTVCDAAGECIWVNGACNFKGSCFGLSYVHAMKCHIGEADPFDPRFTSEGDYRLGARSAKLIRWKISTFERAKMLDMLDELADTVKTEEGEKSLTDALLHISMGKYKAKTANRVTQIVYALAHKKALEAFILLKKHKTRFPRPQA